MIGGHLAETVQREEVRRIRAGHVAHHDRGIGDAARHRAAAVVRDGDRDDALPADEPLRGREADQVVLRRGMTDRRAGLRAETHLTEQRGDTGTGTGAGTAGDLRQVVGIQRLSAQRARARAAARELVQVRLRQDDRAGLAQLAHGEGVVHRLRAGQRLRSAGGRQVEGVVVVLHQDRHAVQQRARALLASFLVERLGGLDRLRIHGEDRVELGAGFVVGLDALEIRLHDLLGREPRVVGLLQIEDRRGLEIERGGAGGPRPRARGHSPRERERRIRSVSRFLTAGCSSAAPSPHRSPPAPCGDASRLRTRRRPR